MLKKALQKEIQNNGMFSSCLGRRTTASRSVSPTPDESAEDEPISVDYSHAIKLEESTICLRTSQRKAFNELIEILSDTSKSEQKWKERWHQTASQHLNDETGPNINWQLFDACVLSVDDLIEENQRSIEELTTAKDTVPKLEKKQLLKFKINQARAEVNKLTKELDALKEDQHKVGRKIHRRESNVSSNSLETRTEKLCEQRKLLKGQIKSKLKALDKAQLRFIATQERFYEESKGDQVRRCELLKNQLNDFIEALHIGSAEVAEKLKDFNAAENMQRWEQDVLRRCNEQSNQSDSNDQDGAVRTSEQSSEEESD